MGCGHESAFIQSSVSVLLVTEHCRQRQSIALIRRSRDASSQRRATFQPATPPSSHQPPGAVGGAERRARPKGHRVRHNRDLRREMAPRKRHSVEGPVAVELNVDKEGRPAGRRLEHFGRELAVAQVGHGTLSVDARVGHGARVREFARVRLHLRAAVLPLIATTSEAFWTSPTL